MRPAVPDDLPMLRAIRDRAGADALSDPALVTDELLDRLIAAEAVTVWDDGAIAGFAAVDGATIHLLVDATRRHRGIGRDLLASASDAVRAAGHPAAALCLSADSSAARHYRAAGWMEAGRAPTGGRILKRPS